MFINLIFKVPSLTSTAFVNNDDSLVAVVLNENDHDLDYVLTVSSKSSKKSTFHSLSLYVLENPKKIKMQMSEIIPYLKILFTILKFFYYDCLY